MHAPTPASRPATHARPWARRIWLAVAVALGAAAAIVVALAARRPPTTVDPDELFPLPTASASAFLNTHPDVQYVGSAVCAQCHVGYAASFRRMGMGRSMARIDLDREPPDGAYDHPLSKRRYEVVRKDGQLWHRELFF
jgi:hypothetical protein